MTLVYRYRPVFSPVSEAKGQLFSFGNISTCPIRTSIEVSCTDRFSLRFSIPVASIGDRTQLRNKDLNLSLVQIFDSEKLHVRTHPERPSFTGASPGSHFQLSAVLLCCLPDVPIIILHRLALVSVFVFINIDVAFTCWASLGLCDVVLVIFSFRPGLR